VRFGNGAITPLASCGSIGSLIVNSLWRIAIDPHRGGSISLRPFSTPWSIRAVPLQPTPLPSSPTTRVSKAQGAKKSSTYGTKYTSSKMRVLASHRAKRLTRLSGSVPLDPVATTLGHGVLLLATMPRSKAARVVKGRAHRLWGSPGDAGLRAARMARYWRRVSRLVCSFWMGRACQ
jgi:hypothetical protein